MRGKSVLLIVVALGCGLVASVGISQIMNKEATLPSTPTKKIFVASSDIGINERITAKMVNIEEWPTHLVPEGCIDAIENLIDYAPRQILLAGEPMVARKLLDPKLAVGVTGVIPPGHRAVAVKVSVNSAASGLIQPGDRVDVIVFLTPKQGIAETMMRTVLHDVRVFSVGKSIVRETDEESGKTKSVKTMTLALTPHDTLVVGLAERIGDLSLTLRRRDEEGDGAKGSVTIDNLFGESSKYEAPQEESFLEDEPEEDFWHIDIVSPAGIKRYEFTDTSLAHIIDETVSSSTESEKPEDLEQDRAGERADDKTSGDDAGQNGSGQQTGDLEIAQ